MLVLSNLTKYNIKAVRYARQINLQGISTYSSTVNTQFKVITRHTRYTKWRLIYESVDGWLRISLIYVDNMSINENLCGMGFMETYIDNRYSHNLLTIHTSLTETTIKIKKQIFSPKYTHLAKWIGII